LETGEVGVGTRITDLKSSVLRLVDPPIGEDYQRDHTVLEEHVTGVVALDTVERG
jgi:hypothetical protein